MSEVLKNINTDKVGNHKILFLEKTDSFNEIYFYVLNSVKIVGDSLYYPNNLLYSYNDNKLYQPLEEYTMSLKTSKQNKLEHINLQKPNKHYRDPVFYFNYNTENYYHFIYDTLPYLISYFELKKNIKNLKLLMYYSYKNNFYKFVIEFLTILGINQNDIVIIDNDTLYETIYVSSTYTYGSDPKQTPREEIYELYKSIVNNVLNNNIKPELPKKIYVSRRSWLHNDHSNIGTNYTTRRKCLNEDELVNFLKQKGYEEIFTEKLSTIDKILLFNNADAVIGAIGGGLVNVLFSKPDCKLTAIISPTFLDVNYRFTYSFNKIKTQYFTDTNHVEVGEFKKFMRVQCENLVGEIEDIFENELLIKYSDVKVTGWSVNSDYKQILIKKDKCIKLDDGLNANWYLNLDTLNNIVI